ncbi:MAG: hypothetical protein QNJ97_01280 [Myxococcota bacterium]|nr:hypothetical protein [Myxococcota bacterium]
MEPNSPSSQGEASLLEISLAQLNATLEREREALLRGDAKEVARLAKEKEDIAAILQKCDIKNTADTKGSSEIGDLARRVTDLVHLNHALLKQMYDQYHGMLELFLRLAGRGDTYSKDGTLLVESTALNSTEFTA